jgi:3-oxoacyl-[acyl-carrier-protein] synthase II
VKCFDASACEQWLAAEVKGFDPRSYFRITKTLKLTDRKTQFAVAAAAMAVADAALSEADLQAAGVVIGSGTSDLQMDEFARAFGSDLQADPAVDIPCFARQVLYGLNPLWLVVNLPNMVSAHIAIQLGACGPNSTVMTDWIAGAQAIGEALHWIRQGEADVVLAGGADSSISARAIVSYAQGGLCAGGENGHPTGFVIGEGAGVLVIEELQHAQRRGARIYAEVPAYATVGASLDCCDAGVLDATMRQTLQQSGWEPDSLSAVCCASVFGEPYLRTETAALARLFAQPRQTSFIEYKSRIGHTLSASGAIESALLARSLLDAPKPARALCNCLGFSGQGATIAFIN